MEILLENDNYRLIKTIRNKFGSYEIEYCNGCFGWCLAFKVNSLPVAYSLFKRLTNCSIRLNVNDILEG